MYDRHLDTFLEVADCGSFLKASEKLYISANAVTKQINLLESDLGVKLFQRSKQGLTLTEAGKLIYAEAKKMIRHSRSVLQKARGLESSQEYTIRMGVSLMNPATILLEHWHRVAAAYPNFRLEIVPFEDTVPSFQEVLNNLGDKIDLVACPYETNFWGDRYNSFHLCDLPVRITCSKSHPLAAKEQLVLSDLFGQTLVFGQPNTSPYADKIRHYLEQFPEIQIRDTPIFDLGLFNKIAVSGELLVSADCWKDVHPLLKTLPMDWEFTMPYGFIYAKEPPKEMLQFIMAIGKILT